MYKNKVVIVTGGLGGIGKAIAQRYLQEGAKVAVVDIDEQKGHALHEAFNQKYPNQCLFVCADVGDYELSEKAFLHITHHFGDVDILINNAGISPKHNGAPIPFYQMSPTEWNQVTAVNLHSAFNWSRLVTPSMVERKSGRIICMSSVAGKVNLIGIVAAHYSTTKAALIGFTRHLAGELGPFGITVNALAPGRINTPLLKSVTSKTNEEVVLDTPLGRLGEPTEVADCCLFLTSDEASFVTGQVIDVAGGWSLT